MGKYKISWSNIKRNRVLGKQILLSMINIKLSEENNIIIFRDEEKNGLEIYSISNDVLGLCIQYDDTTISNWVSQLSSKNWVSSSLLYRLANIIQSKCPDNNIDWVMTFFLVEKKDYLNRYAVLKQELDGGLTKSDDFMTRVEIGRQENIREVNDEIINQVKSNLKQYGIL